MMELKLTTRYMSGFRGRDAAYICREALRRKLTVPATTKTIYAVFTKRMVDGNCFAIRRPEYTICDPVSRVVGFRGALAWSSKRILAKQYLLGYRYVHIEY